MGYFTVERNRKTTINLLAKEQKFMTKNHQGSMSHASGKEDLRPRLPWRLVLALKILAVGLY